MRRSHAQTYGSRTDVGRVRPQNEDSLLAVPPLFAVADGMGGHEAGEVASEIAIQTLLANAPAKPDAKALQDAVVAANRAVIQAAKTGVGKPGMGTTMTAAMLAGTRLLIAQVGDSRAYLLHNGMLQAVTRDHSLVAELVARGEITEEEARWHPQRSVITRALGSDEQTVPDIYELTVSPGDRLLLCSDGLSGMLFNEQIEKTLLAEPDPQGACDALIIAANAAGGHDNITAIVVDVTGEEAESAVQEKTRRSKMSLAMFVIALTAIIVCSVLGIYLYAGNSAYLIAQDGKVVVYRGLIGQVAGISLSWEDHVTTVEVSELPASTAERLQSGVQVASLSDANDLVASYQNEIASSTAAKSSTSSTSSKTSSSGSSGTSSTGSTSSGSSSSGNTTSIAGAVNAASSGSTATGGAASLGSSTSTYTTQTRAED